MWLSGVLRILPAPGFLHAAAQKRETKCQNEEVREDDPCAEQSQVGQGKAQQQNHYRPQIPQHLRDAGMFAAAVIRRLFRDERPARRDVGADCQPDDKEPGDDHPWRDGEDEQSHPSSVDQHIPLVDPLATEPVAQSSADQRADAGTDCIGPERS